MLDIDGCIKNAMKARKNATSEKEMDKAFVELRVFQEIKSEILKLKTAKNAKPYDDVAEIKLLQKLIKEKEEDVQCYFAADRDDIAVSLEEELIVLRSLVPAAPNREEIEILVKNIISKNENNFKMGEIIKMVKSEFPTADGKMVSEIVKSYLTV